MPVNFNETNLHNFLQTTKKNWITKTYEYYKKFNANFGKKYDDKFYLYYLGQKYRVDIAKDVINNAIISSSINKITFHVLNKKNQFLMQSNFLSKNLKFNMVMKH